MTYQRKINETYTVPLSAEGNGEMWFGAHGRNVKLERIFVRTAPYGQEGSVKIYEQYVDPSYILYSSPKGSSGDSQEMDLVLEDGTGVWVQWVSSAPNATGIARFIGIEEREESKRGFYVS